MGVPSAVYERTRTAGLTVVQRLASDFGERPKSFGGTRRGFRQRAPIQFDSGLLEALDEAAVREAVRPYCGVYPGDPKPVEKAPAPTPVGEGVLPGFEGGVPGDTVKLSAGAAETLGPF
jgi:hypothetical protein